MNECAKEIEWAGGKHVFNLNHPRVLEVLAGARRKNFARTRTGALQLDPLSGQYGDTPAAALRRFEEGVYSIADVERVLLYGLWGGGMGFAAADALVGQHVRNQPVARNAVVAYGVIAALFVGAEDVNASA